MSANHGVPTGVKPVVHFRGMIGHFDMAAPITGDLIYRAEVKDEVVHFIVTNPDAAEHQHRLLRR